MEFVIGGLAATSAGIFTNPLEVIKHHLELNKKSQLNSNIHGSFVKTGMRVAQRDGLKSLQKGLSPALGSYLVSYGIKLGTYEFSQNRGLTTDEKGQTNVLKSVSTSTMGGLAGQYLSNPFYMVKAKHDMATNNKHKESGYMDTVKRIYRENGARGFFRGASTSLPRALIGTSQLTSFAVARENLQKFELFKEHSLLTTILAGTVAGVVLSMAMTPFDLVLTKMYKQAIGAKNNTSPYSGYLDCMKKVYAKKGLRPFYSGMAPLYMKLGPHTVLCLVFWEEFKSMYKNMDENNISNQKSSYASNNKFYEKIGFLGEDASLESFEELLDVDTRSVYWN